MDEIKRFPSAIDEKLLNCSHKRYWKGT